MSNRGEPDGLDGWVWIDGNVMAAADATVSVFDHGLTVGDGVFETLKVTDGTPFALTRHLARLKRSVAGLGLEVPLSDSELRHAIAEVLERWDEPLGRLRMTITGGPCPMGSGRGTVEPTVIMAVNSLAPAPPATAAATVPWPRNERSAVAGLKTTSYAENVVALAEAGRQGATEALLANTRGELCEGTGSNVFVVLEGRLVTPPLSSGCLAGVTRDLVLESGCGATEEAVPMQRLSEATEVLLTSSTRDVQAVSNLDGRDLPGAEGPLGRAAADAFAALEAESSDP